MLTFGVYEKNTKTNKEENISEISAGDVEANPLTVVADNFGQFSSSGMFSIGAISELPEIFALLETASCTIKIF